MINDETRRKLREIQLEEMIQVIDRQAKDTIYATLSFDERMKMIVDYVYQEKHNKRVVSLIKRARFRIPNVAIQDVFFAERHLDKDLILEIASGTFISNNQNLVICGFTGSGKSYLACSIGKEACKQGIRTRYIRLPDLLMEYSEAKIQPNGQSRELKKYSNYPLLILDEWLITDLSDDELHFLYNWSNAVMTTVLLFSARSIRSRSGMLVSVVVFWLIRIILLWIALYMMLTLSALAV